ncbi:hypothetical protein LY76DRAFT_63491 [Colletotrichum caudatum]|nr:hypothetical protein LY76DRAFT_63491 [Colletotrichum caudatum]
MLFPFLFFSFLFFSSEIMRSATSPLPPPPRSDFSSSAVLCILTLEAFSTLIRRRGKGRRGIWGFRYQEGNAEKATARLLRTYVPDTRGIGRMETKVAAVGLRGGRFFPFPEGRNP